MHYLSWLIPSWNCIYMHYIYLVLYLSLASDFEEIVGKRMKEVSNFVEMLRSASENEQNKSHELHADWKVN